MKSVPCVRMLFVCSCLRLCILFGQVCVEMHEHHHIVDVYLELPHSPKGIGADGQRCDADMCEYTWAIPSLLLFILVSIHPTTISALVYSRSSGHSRPCSVVICPHITPCTRIPRLPGTCPHIFRSLSCTTPRGFPQREVFGSRLDYSGDNHGCN